MDKVEDVQITVVGHPTSGKTTFINKVMEGPMRQSLTASQMNFDMRKKSGMWLGQTMEVRLWDTRDLITNSNQGKLAMKGKDLVIIVFDISSNESLQSVARWIRFTN